MAQASASLHTRSVTCPPTLAESRDLGAVAAGQPPRC